MSEVDAENLIAVLKEFIDNKIYYPDIGETKEYEVKSLTSHDLFIINIYRKSKNRDKYSIQIRLKGSNIKLLRLDIGSTLSHKNSNGKIIHGSHLHIFKENIELSDAMECKSNDSFIDDCIFFMKKVNVINYPKTHQECFVFN